MTYRRASKKQEEYIATLCAELDILNPTLYTKYRLEDASKLIEKLKKRLQKKQELARQVKLL